MMENYKHKTVLLDEAVNGLNIRPDGIYIDGTFGRGGHSRLILSQLGEEGRLLAIDRDPQAIAVAQTINDPRFSIVHGPFSALADYVAERGLTGKIDGILLDLGVSSPQLDDAERGFSFMRDGPLDMRMDQRGSETAADIVNTYSESELYRIIRDYGEDRFAKNIAKHIVKRRQEKLFETAGELAETIRAAIPARVRATGGHPAKRTFQAIRIELNHELDVLENSIDRMIDFLNPGGRLSIITFHSLEDRIVKSRFRLNENPCICPPDFPVCVCGRRARGKWCPENPYCRQMKNWRKTAALKAQSCASLSGDSLSQKTRPFSGH